MPSWWDRFGAEWASSGLTDDPTNAQADAGWAFIGQAPPTVEQFNSMFQWSDDKDNWLYGQVANCIIGSGVTPLSNDLMQLWNAIKSLQRHKLDGDTAFYVDAINGNDVTGSGGINSPWKTIQHAISFIYNNIDVSGYNAIVQLAPGTYDIFTAWQPVNGNIVVQGDPLNPRAYLIKSLNGSAIAAVASAVLFVNGLSVEAVGQDSDYTSAGIGLYADRGGIILYDNMAFGACSWAQMQAGPAGGVHPSHGASTHYAIYAGGQKHIASYWSGVVTNVRATVTITNNPTFTDAFAVASLSGAIQAWLCVYNGTCVGKRHRVDTTGMVNSGGNINIFPGTVAGSVDAGTYGVFI